MKYALRLHGLTALCLVLCLGTGRVAFAGDEANDDVIARVRAYREQNQARILSDYSEFLKIPNVSSDLANIQRNADYIKGQLERRGVRVELWRIANAAPIVYGRLDAPGAKQTLGVYLHYDGQPVDESKWAHAPWQPVLYTRAMDAGGKRRELPRKGEAVDPEWRLYARSASDDKVPLAAILTALDALRENQISPAVHLVFFFEGEEEAGSAHLGQYMRDHREALRVDGWLICDGPVHQTRRPQLAFGVRGITGLDITVYGAERYLHSGHYGNWAPNPAMRLAQLLAGMQDRRGRVRIRGFYRSVARVGAAERAAIRSVPKTDDELRQELGLAATENNNQLLVERLMLPSLNIRGLVSAAVGDAASNIIPNQATASIDIRLVAGNDPEQMIDLVEAHIRKSGYHIVREDPDHETRLRYPRIAKVERRVGYPAARTSPEHPFARAVATATRRASDEPLVMLPTMGGSLPLYLFNQELGAPLVIAPMANHDNNQHAANENLRIANLWYGIELMAAVFTMEAW